MRHLPTVSLFAVLVAALPVGGQTDDAAKLFRKMEQTLTRAKSLRASALVVFKTPDGDMKLAGAILLGEGDRAKFTFDSTVGEKPRKGTLVSDGKKMGWVVNGAPGPTEPTPPGLNKLLAAKFARAGVGFSFFLAVGENSKERQAKDIDRLYPASDFRLGPKEKVGDQTAQVVQYKLTWAGKGPVFQAVVWLDVQTHLPLKRTLTATKDGNTIRITEVYTNVALNVKVDGKVFDLPK